MDLRIVRFATSLPSWTRLQKSTGYLLVKIRTAAKKVVDYVRKYPIFHSDVMKLGKTMKYGRELTLRTR
jgi:hypothetical protein